MAWFEDPAVQAWEHNQIEQTNKNPYDFVYPLWQHSSALGIILKANLEKRNFPFEIAPENSKYWIAELLARKESLDEASQKKREQALPQKSISIDEILDRYENIKLQEGEHRNPYWFVTASWGGKYPVDYIFDKAFPNEGHFNLQVPHIQHVREMLLQRILQRKQGFDNKIEHARQTAIQQVFADPEHVTLRALLDHYEKIDVHEKPLENPYWFLKGITIQNPDIHRILNTKFSERGHFPLPVPEDQASCDDLLLEIFRRGNAIDALAQMAKQGATEEQMAAARQQSDDAAAAWQFKQDELALGRAKVHKEYLEWLQLVEEAQRNYDQAENTLYGKFSKEDCRNPYLWDRHSMRCPIAPKDFPALEQEKRHVADLWQKLRSKICFMEIFMAQHHIPRVKDLNDT